MLFFTCEHDSSEPMSNIECERLYCIKKNNKNKKYLKNENKFVILRELWHDSVEA
jgi:hypothetical protein